MLYGVFRGYGIYGEPDHVYRSASEDLRLFSLSVSGMGEVRGNPENISLSFSLDAETMLVSGSRSEPHQESIRFFSSTGAGFPDRNVKFTKYQKHEFTSHEVPSAGLFAGWWLNAGWWLYVGKSPSETPMTRVRLLLEEGREERAYERMVELQRSYHAERQFEYELKKVLIEKHTEAV